MDIRDLATESLATFIRVTTDLQKDNIIESDEIEGAAFNDMERLIAHFAGWAAAHCEEPKTAARAMVDFICILNAHGIFHNYTTDQITEVAERMIRAIIEDDELISPPATQTKRD